MMRNEFKQYRKVHVDSNVELKEPFALWWWRQNEFVYPHVAPVAKGVHGSPGSEIENERVFSIAGLITQWPPQAAHVPWGFGSDRQHLQELARRRPYSWAFVTNAMDDLCAHVQELLEQDEMELVENNYADLVEQGEIFDLSSEDFGDE